MLSFLLLVAASSSKFVSVFVLVGKRHTFLHGPEASNHCWVWLLVGIKLAAQAKLIRIGYLYICKITSWLEKKIKK